MTLDESYLVSKLASINPSALYVPLGDKVVSVLLELAKKGVIKEDQVLAGL